MPKPWRIEMLGGLTIHCGGRDALPVRRGKHGSLLAFLAYHTRYSHPREALVERFWPDADSENGLGNLRAALSALRRKLESSKLNTDEILQAEYSGVRLNSANLQTDVTEFETLLGQGQAAGPKQKSFLTHAVNLYKGDLLPGFEDEWIEPERERLANDYLAALQKLVTLHWEAGEPEKALQYAQRVLQRMPAWEAAHSDVIHLYAWLGRNAEAVRQFGVLQRVLKQEDERPPAKALAEMVKELRDTPEGRIGRHVWKSRGDRAAREEAPAPPVLRLPDVRTRFFGREEETAKLLHLLLPSVEVTSRLVTLTGPGGMGKTRLSIEIGKRAAAEFGLSVTFVPLSDVYHASLIATAIRNALGLEASYQIEPLEQVVTALSRSPMLLILDNFEHLAAQGTTEVLTLLNRVPGLMLLITSQRRLRVAGEETLALSPLPLPEKGGAPKASAEKASVHLYVDRARAVNPAFALTPQNRETVARLCRRLEGIPLALELAAARADVLTPDETLARLTKRFEMLTAPEGERMDRHSSLWTTIAWSYDLLQREAQQFIARLSVFRDGFDALAAEAVCLPDLHAGPGDEEREAGPAALNLLAQLQAASLITSVGGAERMRFHLLETLREFAAQRLSPAEQNQASLNQAQYYMQLAEQAIPYEGREEYSLWMRRLERDKENLRAALHWCGLEPERAELELRIARSLTQFWYRGGYLREGREWLEKALAGPCDGCESLLTRALNGLGMLAWALGDYETAQRRYEECLELSRRQGKPLNIAASLNNLGLVAKERGDLVRMQALLQESIEAYRLAGREDLTGSILANLGASYMELENHANAEKLLKESVELLERSGDRDRLATALGNLGELACIQGDAKMARAYLERNFEMAMEGQLHLHLDTILFWMGMTVFLEGDPRRAARLCGSAEALRGKTGKALSAFESAHYPRYLQPLRDSLPLDEFETLWARGRLLNLEDAIALAHAPSPKSA